MLIQSKLFHSSFPFSFVCCRFFLWTHFPIIYPQFLAFIFALSKLWIYLGEADQIVTSQTLHRDRDREIEKDWHTFTLDKQNSNTPQLIAIDRFRFRLSDSLSHAKFWRCRRRPEMLSTNMIFILYFSDHLQMSVVSAFKLNWIEMNSRRFINDVYNIMKSTFIELNLFFLTLSFSCLQCNSIQFDKNIGCLCVSE